MNDRGVASKPFPHIEETALTVVKVLEEQETVFGYLGPEVWIREALVAWVSVLDAV